MANKKPIVLVSGRPVNIPVGDVLDLTGSDTYVLFDEHTSAPSTPTTGSVALYAKANGLMYSKDDVGTETQLGGLYDIAVTSVGQPVPGVRILQFAAVRAYQIPANFSGCVAKVRLTATSSAVFSIRKNDTQFGTVTFSAGQTSGTFSSSSLTSFAVGDLLSIVAPSPQDATLADVSVSFAAILT